MTTSTGTSDDAGSSVLTVNTSAATAELFAKSDDAAGRPTDSRSGDVICTRSNEDVSEDNDDDLLAIFACDLRCLVPVTSSYRTVGRDCRKSRRYNVEGGILFASAQIAIVRGDVLRSAVVAINDDLQQNRSIEIHQV